MAQTRGSPWDRRQGPTVRELFFLNRLSPLLCVATLIGVFGVAIAVGRLALLAHIHFATERDAGEQLNPFAMFLGTGSGPLTAAPGWIAAAFFVYALVRLRSGPLEPPPGGGAERSVKELRSALRAEFRLVRLAFLGLALVAVIDATRAFEYVVAVIRGNLVARDSLPMTLVEAGGLVAAAITLGLWAWHFRQDLDRLGAL
jgi:hypothetical protein